MNLRTLGRRVLQRFAVHRGRLVLSLLLIVTSTGIGVVSPLLLRQILDRAIPRHDRALLTVLCLAMLAVGISQALLFLAQNRLTNSIGLTVVHELRMDVYRRVQSMPITFHAGPAGAEAHTRLSSDLGAVSDVVTSTAGTALASVTMVATAGTAMLVLSWPIALVAIALTAALAVVNHRYAERQRTLAAAAQSRTSDLMRLAGEHLTLTGVLLGRTLLRWHRQRAEFADTSAAIVALTARQRAAGTTAMAIISTSLAAVPPLVYWLAGGGVSSLTVGTALVLVALQLQLSGPIRDLLGMTARLRMSLVQFERIFEYVDMGPVEALPGPVAAGAGPAAVRLRGVGYAYPGTGRTVLNRVDLDLPAGSVTTVVGATGSGKSTLAYVIAGLLRPDRGTVTVPGLPGVPLPEVVTLVPQEAGLFNTTIRENLLFARPGADDAELLGVLAPLGLDTLVDGLPAGLGTEVGDRGHQLSGGERQRLALARALLAPGRVLVLDEVTSSLDWATGRRVQDAIAALAPERTLVVISHRLAGVRDGDRVVVMRAGEICESGTHGSLRATSGEYARLIQARGTDVLADQAW